MCLSYKWLDALLDMTAGVAVFPAFRKYDSHFEDEADQYSCVTSMLARPRIEKRRVLHTSLPRVCLDRAITNWVRLYMA